MSSYNVPVDLEKTYEVLKSLEASSSETELSVSLKKASALREASKYLRSVSVRNRQIAQEAREMGRQVTQAFV